MNSWERKIYSFIMLLLIIIPTRLYAYSDYIIASGENVGIRIFSEGIMVVGTYDINGIDPAKEAGIEDGDIILKINGNAVNKTEELAQLISNSNGKTVKILFERNGENKTTTLKLVKVGESLKTGLYIKDSITGIGTLTYIDPNTKVFGALGHEIINNASKEIVALKDGTIFPSTVTGITRSKDGNPGEKNATFDSNKIDGVIMENTNKGIFGNYTANINVNKLYKVANLEDIKTGKAQIKTVLDGNKVEEYDIDIISVSNTEDKVKNIIFEITDKNLIEKANGIVQGMSGSPIIQKDNIIGAVTHVVVDDPLKGYGILITNMLEEGEN